MSTTKTLKPYSVHLKTKQKIPKHYVCLLLPIKEHSPDRVTSELNIWNEVINLSEVEEGAVRLARSTQKEMYQKHKGWNTPLRSSSPTFDWTPPCKWDHSTECYVQLFLEYLQGEWLHPFPGQLIPRTDHLFNEEILPDTWTFCHTA